MGIKESDTGLAATNLWDVAADKQRQQEHPLQVARCQTIIRASKLSVKASLTSSEPPVRRPAPEPAGRSRSWQPRW